MRPQRNAADHTYSDATNTARYAASMRPQRNAADHCMAAGEDPGTTRGFNEAAAERCGSREGEQRMVVEIIQLQ